MYPFFQKDSKWHARKLKIRSFSITLTLIFWKYGRPVTDEYLRFENGPVPRMGEKFLKRWTAKKSKSPSEKVAEGYNDQQHIEALAEFDVNVFEKEELLMLEEIANKWKIHRVRNEKR